MGIQDGGGQYRIDGTKQKKKKKKQNPAKKGPDGLLAGGHARLSSHSVTFNDIPTGLTKETVLYVDPSRHNFGRRATLCESLFGIIPGYFSTKRNGTNGTVPDSRIMVQGLLPGGEAIKTGIKIGKCSTSTKHSVLCMTRKRHGTMYHWGQLYNYARQRHSYAFPIPTLPQ